ncbi:MAG: hypothetical protein OMM_14370 [Candidatus Magnetoglobus multicellularis str. Araruama]|uniref:Uncharacterized protein n=1 Tax=Candidatus Magnetoglobus multicellularis str. Araruama TaxID=890399 RepID=A0A1V1NS00_9BACT|nr:MAG: hypothetical protein OMM_14370 [Candidatus Magnetoglobus multicellularis str. Araruama]
MVLAKPIAFNSGMLKTGECFLYRYSFGPNSWLALLPDGRFDASQEGLRKLAFTDIENICSVPAEDLVKEFHRPEDVQAVIDGYL